VQVGFIESISSNVSSPREHQILAYKRAQIDDIAVAEMRRTQTPSARSERRGPRTPQREIDGSGCGWFEQLAPRPLRRSAVGALGPSSVDPPSAAICSFTGTQVLCDCHCGSTTYRPRILGDGQDRELAHQRGRALWPRTVFFPAEAQERAVRQSRRVRAWRKMLRRAGRFSSGLADVVGSGGRCRVVFDAGHCDEFEAPACLTARILLRGRQTWARSSYRNLIKLTGAV